MRHFRLGENQAFAETTLKPPVMRTIVLARADPLAIDLVRHRLKTGFSPGEHALRQVRGRFEPGHRLQVCVRVAAVTRRHNLRRGPHRAVRRIVGPLDRLELLERAPLGAGESVPLQSGPLPKLALQAVLITALIENFLRDHQKYLLG